MPVVIYKLCGGDEVTLWVEPGGAIMLKVVQPYRDSV